MVVSISAPLREPDVVDEHVDAAELAHGGIDNGPHAGIGRHIGDRVRRSRAGGCGLRQRRGRLLERIFAARAHEHVRALGDQRLRRCQIPSPRLPPVTMATLPCQIQP